MKFLEVVISFRNKLCFVLLAMLSFTVMAHSVTGTGSRASRFSRSSSIVTDTEAPVIGLPQSDASGIRLAPEINSAGSVVELPIKTRVPKFTLYTLNTRDTGQVITARMHSLRTSNFVASAPLKIYVHGFMSSENWSALEFKTAYLQRNQTINVVLVDWEHLAAGTVFKYRTAARNTKIVGRRIAELITRLYAEHFIEFKDVHIIGHSLGAHVARFAGRFIGAGRIGRITALDPAKTYFNSLQTDDQVGKSDAAFVDVIHTNTKILGLAEAVGHVDFYPNGGKSQPGCGADAIGTCSHGRANDYMIESINNPKSFHSWKCPNMIMCFREGKAHMGEHVEHSARGEFYVNTHCEKPFSKSH